MWEVVISTETFRVNIYIFRDAGGRREMLRVLEDGSFRIDTSEPDFSATTTPTFAFNMRDGHGILQGLAGQLAQHGFGALSATPVVNAQDRHIKSLETQAERLFTLARKE